jgi:hypothetical protein
MEIRTLKEAKKHDVIILDDNKKYLVLNCRKLIPFLGEQKGYLLTLEEIK